VTEGGLVVGIVRLMRVMSWFSGSGRSLSHSATTSEFCSCVLCLVEVVYRWTRLTSLSASRYSRSTGLMLPTLFPVKGLKLFIGNPSQSYRALTALCDHTVLLASKHS